jgi:hypothetical protein
LVIDEFTKEVSLSAARGTSSKEGAKLLYEQWLCKRGWPLKIVSDRAKGYMTVFFRELTLLAGSDAKYSYTSSRRPAANGQAENFFSRVVAHLRCHCDKNAEWPDMLSTIELGHRATVHKGLGISPFHALYGFQMRLPQDLAFLDRSADLPPAALTEHFGPQLTVLREILKENLQDEKRAMEKTHNKNRLPHSFKVGDRVFLLNDYFRHTGPVSSKHLQRYLGPHLLVSVSGPLCKLQNFYTGKMLPGFINADKLRKLSDEGREVLYNKYNKRGEVSTDTPVADQTLVNALSDDGDEYDSVTQQLQLVPIDLSMRQKQQRPMTTITERMTDGTTVKSAMQERARRAHDVIDLSTPNSNLGNLTNTGGTTVNVDKKRVPVRITARRIKKPFAFYKTYFEGQSEPEWIAADKLPVKLLTTFSVQRYQQRQNFLSARQMNNLVNDN